MAAILSCIKDTPLLLLLLLSTDFQSASLTSVWNMQSRLRPELGVFLFFGERLADVNSVRYSQRGAQTLFGALSRNKRCDWFGLPSAISRLWDFFCFFLSRDKLLKGVSHHMSLVGMMRYYTCLDKVCSCCARRVGRGWSEIKVRLIKKNNNNNNNNKLK